MSNIPTCSTVSNTPTEITNNLFFRRWNMHIKFFLTDYVTSSDFCQLRKTEIFDSITIHTSNDARQNLSRHDLLTVIFCSAITRIFENLKHSKLRKMIITGVLHVVRSAYLGINPKSVISSCDLVSDSFLYSHKPYKISDYVEIFINFSQACKNRIYFFCRPWYYKTV